MIQKQDINSGESEALNRELPTYSPLIWWMLKEGSEREALRLEQEKPGYKFFNH